MKNFTRLRLNIIIASVFTAIFIGCTMTVERLRFVESTQEVEISAETEKSVTELPEETEKTLETDKMDNKEDEAEEKENDTAEADSDPVDESSETESGGEEENPSLVENGENENSETQNPENDIPQETDDELQNVSEQENELENQSEGEQETELESEPDPSMEVDPETDPEVPPDPMQEMPEPPKLTLVVYMAADNDLESYAIQNLKAMEHADFSKMNVLVLLDRSEGFDETNGDWTDTRLFELAHDDTDSNIIVSKRLSCPPLGITNKIETELDMGNPSVLWNLLNFARNNYESEKYALIIWGHGTGWRYSAGNLSGISSSNLRAAAIDDRTGSYMSVHDMGRALRNQGLAVIGFDTCFGGVFENVYELKNHAEYTVASPGITPSGGWDYKTLLEDISDSYFSSKEIADAMAANSLVNITVFNNQKLYSLMNDIEEFSKALASTVKNSSSRNSVYSKLLTVKSYSYTQYPCDMYLDIYSMADVFKSNSDSTLSSAAKKLQKTVNSSAKTSNSSNAEIGIHFIPKTSAGTTAVTHSIDYIKDVDNTDQCMFIKESQGWVPTKNGESESLLDKLFYASL